MDQVHTAWLMAGAAGDVATMRLLLAQHPQWLDLERLVVDSTAPRRFCSWEGFHLPTIGASALHTAAWEGSLGIVELMLQARQDPDTRDDGGLAPMMVAMLRFNIVVMRSVFRNNEAVRRNVVVDCREEESELLQHVVGVIELLMRYGADVNARNQDGYTMLHYVANGDAIQIGTLLLEAGADIDAQDQKGKTPLHQCIHEDSLLVANLLVSRGAQIDIADVNGVTPLMLTLNRRNMSMLQIILNQHHMLVTPERRDFAASVLLSAVESAAEEAVHLIVDRGYSSVGVSNVAGETPLHRAIVKRNSQLMELLIRLDVTSSNLTAVTVEGESPVHYAARYGSASEMETLLRYLTTRFGDLRALEDEMNPLYARNNDDATGLYLAATSEASINRRQEERYAITQLLLLCDARLFPRGSVVVCSSSGSAAQIVLHEQVRRGLMLWIREMIDRNDVLAEGGALSTMEIRTSDVLLTELCVDWASSVTSLALRSTSAVGRLKSNGSGIAAVLTVVISAGYALEFLPLLLELPVLRSATPALLRRLERFSRSHRPNALLLQCHAELLEALAENAEAEM